jgi:LCP family protein required for cell wall assembly
MDKQDCKSEYEEHSADKTQILNDSDKIDENNKPSRLKKKILMLSAIFFLILLLIFGWLILTKSGRRVIYRIAGSFIYQGLDKDEDLAASSVIVPVESKPDIDEKDEAEDLGVDNKETNIDKEKVVPKKRELPRKEDYVSNYLIFGLEQIENAENADTIMIASINSQDSTIKLTSILRDTYIEVEGYRRNKINAFFSLGGAKTLVNVIEDKYRLKIDGYAYINFESFESIVDYLGGIDIEIGEEEAEYLNRTNYISKPENRTLITGWNELNGNQALGYCRVRRVETIGGANDDYGRTLRQRKVLRAVFNKYKSKGVLDLLRISNNIFKFIKTNVSQKQIEKTLEDIIENKITKMDTMRVPVNGAFETPKEYNGIGYPLIYDWDENITQLYQFIYLDTKEEAYNNMKKYR